MTALSGIFPARLAALGGLKTLVEDFSVRAPLSRDDCLRLTLIVEELFTNTVRHGHGGDSDARVELTLEARPSTVALTYLDSAPPFDPLAAALQADTSSPIEERRVGGLGILLSVSLSRQASYAYVDGRNRVELVLVRDP
jgi:serine/threonine-protein kinase RsbW